MNGERTDPVLNKINAANKTRTRINGISHHFFSRHANDKHSLSSCHIVGGIYNQVLPLLQGTHPIQAYTIDYFNLDLA
tara:strand:- start:128 stop:361 length:234 start_codon:yes stop_codon:yes gene_type:complete